MVKDDQKSIKVVERQADDFKLINGIKAGIENRLHEAGIRSYEQLASLTPNEILLKLGKASRYSADRIQKENWIGQARMLASRKAQRKFSKKEASSPARRQHYENFTVEFLLDETNRLRRARIVHVQSGDADTWSGWDASQFMDFIARHSSVRLPGTRPASSKFAPVPSSNQTESLPQKEEIPAVPAKLATVNIDTRPSVPMPESPPAPTSPVNRLSMGTVSSQPEILVLPENTPAGSILQFLAYKIFLGNKEQPMHRSLPHDQAFDVCLIFGLQNIFTTQATLSNPTAILYAKKLGGGREILERVRNIQLTENKITLSFRDVTLSPGMYRLEAVIQTKYGEVGTDNPQSFEAHWESNPLQIY